MANTLLGYFKDALKAAGRNTKYFTRDFLAVFVADYYASVKAGRSDYTKTSQTAFYQKNGGAYCTFLELWSVYRKAMDILEQTAD